MKRQTFSELDYISIREELAKEARSGRSVNISKFRYLLRERYGLDKVCLWCGQPVVRLNSYCPGHCTAFWSKYLAQYMMGTISKRAGGRCEACSVTYSDLLDAYYERNPGVTGHTPLSQLKEKFPEGHAVHHIIPISLGGDPFEEDNLIYLCHSCHMETHEKIRDDLALLDQSEELDETYVHLEKMDSYWESIGGGFD